MIIETDGRFITEEVAELAVHPGAQCWIIDADRGTLAEAERVRALIAQYRHRGVQVLTAVTATDRIDPTVLAEQTIPVRFGACPTDRDAVWVRRAVHDHYLADQAATEAIVSLARALGQPLPSIQDNRPTASGDAPLQPTVSWDGKVTLNPQDILLASPQGDVVHSRLSADLYGR